MIDHQGPTTIPAKIPIKKVFICADMLFLLAHIAINVMALNNVKTALTAQIKIGISLIETAKYIRQAQSLGVSYKFNEK